MKRFIGAYIDWFDNDLMMTDLVAKDELDAMYRVAEEFGVDTSTFDAEDAEDFKTMCFNMDCMISVKEVK